MKKTNKFKLMLVWMLLLAMMSSSLTFAADTSVADGTTYGASMGAFDGNFFGREAAHANRVNNYLNDLLTDAQIIGKFMLSRDTASFQSSFILAYRDAFQTAYQAGYREVAMSKVIAPVEGAYDHGMSLGTLQGQTEAMLDFIQGRKNDWSVAYNAYVAKGSLLVRYNLLKEVMAYRTAFANGYREGFMTAYITTFQEQNVSVETANKDVKQISMREDSISFDDGTVQLMLHFPAATLYEPTNVTAFTTQNSFNYRNYSTHMTPVTSKYTISILNSRGSVTLLKPITLSFEYYGSERAGVYQWLGNKWVYQYTTLTDGSLFITIPAGTYGGGEYAIFIDEKYKNVSDITFNWAYKEIYTLMRRGVVSDAGPFNPNAKITRGTFALMVYNAISGTDPLGAATKVINDFDSLSWYKEAAKYMVNKGYMRLDANGNFNMNGNVSYADVEHMLSVMSSTSFKWTEISNKMLTEKYTRSAGATNLAAHITKAETAYMLISVFK
ncbi:MAG TPA: hypothetical protein DCS67_03780 [Clostridiales bacterium UBA8960]|nr:hypothetical protein [Clostridiales bacterium UBA8960]